VYIQIVFEISQNWPKCNPNMPATSWIVILLILHILMFCLLTDILQQVTLLLILEKCWKFVFFQLAAPQSYFQPS
jgi:hypothetical protein